ncbi:MAG: DUF4179 domain-containing protein [Paraclostridium sp.]|uniref:DUF4179 domain-containing protein n=1 Tax=Paraclostridium TaxID=1849822 RepID=UPI001C816961|nr:DUF4179 domain-containing protein [Paraclostridium bifermentans]GIM32791.1 hypothetical protein PAGU1678_20610 [Paraclostridium bifermentans subsp. muricolitidis]
MDKMNKVDKIIGGREIPNCVDERIDETKAFIKREKRRKKIIKNTVVSFGLVCVILLGMSVTHPALAEKIPFLGNVMNILKSDKAVSEKMSFVKGVNNKNVKPINEKSVSNNIGITVQEAYCDGSNIFISYIIESENSKLNKSDSVYLNKSIGGGDIKASFSDEQLSEVDAATKKIDENTYAVLQYIDLEPLIQKGINIEDTFDLKINISDLSIWDETGLKYIKGHWKYKLAMKKDDSKNVKFEPNLENNKAVLKKVVLTPGTTEVEVDIPKEFGESAYILAYDDKGNKLDGHTFSYNIESKIGTLEYKKFTPISKDADYIVVKVVDKNTDNLDVFSEFKLPLK